MTIFPHKQYRLESLLEIQQEDFTQFSPSVERTSSIGKDSGFQRKGASLPNGADTFILFSEHCCQRNGGTPKSICYFHTFSRKPSGSTSPILNWVKSSSNIPRRDSYHWYLRGKMVTEYKPKLGATLKLLYHFNSSQLENLCGALAKGGLCSNTLCLLSSFFFSPKSQCRMTD